MTNTAETSPDPAAELSALRAQIDAERTMHAVALDDANHRLMLAELKSAAQAAGLIDADDLRLVDLSQLGLNDYGEVTGVDDVVADLKASKPYLFRPSSQTYGSQTYGSQTFGGQPPGGPTSTTNPASPPAPKEPRARHARDMSADEYRAARLRLTGGK